MAFARPKKALYFPDVGKLTDPQGGEVMGRFERLWRHASWSGDMILPLECKCKQGVVTFRCTVKPGSPPPHVSKNFQPEILLEIASKIHVVIQLAGEKVKQISARFSPKECVELLRGEWPNSDNFDRIANAVRERKNYPMPAPEIPGGGGKSLTAQGQTKKPGSHSQDRHH